MSPLNFSLLRFLRRLICRTPKVPFSFPLLLFVRVSFNPRSRSSFSFPYLYLSFTVHPLHQLPLPLSLSVMFPQLFQPPPPEAIPFPPAAFLLTPFSPSHPTTFRVVYHFSSVSGNPLFPIHQSSTGASFPWNVPRFPLRISITNFRQSNYSLRKEEKKCSFLFRELWKRLAEKGSRWTGGKKEVARHDEWTNRFPSRIFFSIRARERTKA